MNEVGNKYFKKGIQTIAYMPHFISSVVVVSIVNALLSPSSGLLNQIIEAFGGEAIYFMAEPKYFKTIYVLQDIWKSAGYNSIVYLAALTSIDPTMYEAATVDGASKWDKLVRITLPSLLPTIIIMLILRVGGILGVGFEKVFLLQTNLNMSVSRVISTYTYERTLGAGGTTAYWDYSAAIGLFNTFINLALIMITNTISRKVGETSLF
jgi:putative aldouronate transport system permease protein